MHLTEGVWGVSLRFLGNVGVFFAFDGSDNDAVRERSATHPVDGSVAEG